MDKAIQKPRSRISGNERGEDHPFVPGWKWGQKSAAGKAVRSSTEADNV